MSAYLSSVRPRFHGWTATQWFCLIAGGLLVVRGASVLLMGESFGTPGEGWHAAFHLASGLVLVIASRNASVAYPVVAAFAFVYGLVAVAGTIDGHDAFGVVPIDTRDNVIHFAYVAFALGTLAADRRARLAAGAA